MTWGRLLAAVLLVATSGCASTGAAEPPRPPETTAADPQPDPLPDTPLRVLLAGDSIAEGYYASTAADSFGALLLDRWDADGVRVEEAGARAWRIARAVAGLEAAGGLDVDVAVLEVGTNDIGETPLRQYAAVYRDLVAAAERGSPELVVCLGTWDRRARSAPYDRVVARTCDGEGRVYAPLADLHDRPDLHGPAGAPTSYGPSDELHPNDEGHAAIAQRVALVVAEVLPDAVGAEQG